MSKVISKEPREVASYVMSKLTAISALFAIAAFAGTAGSSIAMDVSRNRAYLKFDEHFPENEIIANQAALMVELYLHVDDDDALVFDSDMPNLVLGKIHLGGLSRAQAKDSVERFRANLHRRVTSLYLQKPGEWNGDDSLLHNRFPVEWTPELRIASAGRTWAKKGLKRTFRQSLVRSHAYLPIAKSVFKRQGIPDRLKYLPHIESRFAVEAYSPAQAAGLWQFVPVTGAMYLEINDLVDQRLDPEASTLAAGKLLKKYRQLAGSWPLALMAYHSGIAEILRAVREEGLVDAGEVVSRYRSPAFQRFSRMYYAKYLAASSLAMQADKLFPNLRKASPPLLREVKLQHEWKPMQLRILTGYSLETLRKCNPELRPAVFQRNLELPRGYALKLPQSAPTQQEAAFADLPSDMQGAKTPRTLLVAGFGGLSLPGQGYIKSLVMGWRKNLLSEHHENRERRLFLARYGLDGPNLSQWADEDGIVLYPHPLAATLLTPAP